MSSCSPPEEKTQLQAVIGSSQLPNALGNSALRPFPVLRGMSTRPSKTAKSTSNSGPVPVAEKSATSTGGILVPTSLDVVLMDRIRCLVHIALLVMLIPASCLYAAFAYCKETFMKSGSSKTSADERKTAVGNEKQVITVLVTGAKMSKSLHLARCLKRADPERVKIVLIEIEKYWLSGSRFSNVVDCACARSCSAFMIVLTRRCGRNRRRSGKQLADVGRIRPNHGRFGAGVGPSRPKFVP